MSRKRWRGTLTLGCLFLGLAGGCTTWSPTTAWESMTKPSGELPPPPQETVYRAGHWDAKAALTPGTLEGDTASTRLLFEQGNYADAEKWYHWLGAKADKQKNSEVLEECLFYEAECLFAQGYYPKACSLYARLVKTFPTTRYRKDAIERQNYIAEYWLEDTRKEMQEWEEVREGKRWVVMPRFMHFERQKPTFDEEGHALRTCEAIFTQDPSGPLAPQALFRMGGMNFYREKYPDADLDYSLLVEQYPRSSLAPAAMELAIQSKIQQVSGPDYDGRKLTEARQLVDKAVRNYPELNNKKEFLDRTLYAINEQQAQKDFNVAEFYRRTKHPGAAHFCYEMVRLRYAGTPWEQKALERLNELRQEAAVDLAK